MSNTAPDRSYRCRTRKPNAAPAQDEKLDTFVQIKAPDAVEAMVRAHQVTGLAVIDAERQEG